MCVYFFSRPARSPLGGRMAALTIIILLASGVLFQAQFLVMFLVPVCPQEGQRDMGYGKRTGEQRGA